jgi:hypothetical protein
LERVVLIGALCCLPVGGPAWARDAKSLGEQVYAAIMRGSAKYRNDSQTKVLVACFNWNARSLRGLNPKHYAWWQTSPGSDRDFLPSTLMRNAMNTCETQRAQAGSDCTCTPIDRNGENILEVPAAFAERVQVAGVARDSRCTSTVPMQRGDANYSGFRMLNANFSQADLPRTRFCGSDLKGAIFAAADLRQADMSRADLRGADLRGAVLTGAFLRLAEVDGADFSQAKLAGCDFSGTDLRRAKGLTQQALLGACGDTETQLPLGLRIDACKAR